MNMIWSQRAGGNPGNPLADLHHCLAPTRQADDAESFSGFLSGAWNLRLLLLELGTDVQGQHGPWPQSWFASDCPTIAGLRLQAERWQPDVVELASLDDLDERLEGVGAICLWLGDQPEDPRRARALIELAQQANARGLSVLASGPLCHKSERSNAEMIDFAKVRAAYLTGAAAQECAEQAQQAMADGVSPVKQLLSDLPSDQRFQARVAVLSALAWDLQQSGRVLHGLERRRALDVGETLRLAMAEATTEQWADETMVLLIAAVRAKNTMDTRLRNMANDRLGLLVLLATARLGLRCRSFTVREICRELGAVATGM